MTKAEILEYLKVASGSARPFWGIAVSKAGDASKARQAGASWVTVTHASSFSSKIPASVIGLLPYANANDSVLEKSALATEATLPALASVFASDQFNQIEYLLEKMRDAGFHGVQNFPSVGLAEGRFREFFREADMDYDREIEMVRKAREMDFFVSALVFGPEQAESMVLAGADMVVFHPGLTADGEFRSWTQATMQRFEYVAAMARKRAKDVLLARLAFEWEASARASEVENHGIQYDYNI